MALGIGLGNSEARRAHFTGGGGYGKRTGGHANGSLALYYRVMSPLPPAYLSKELDRPLPTTDGGILRTIRDACDYMTAMDKKRELRQHWQHCLQARPRRHRVEAARLALPLRSFEGLAEIQEPGSASGETRGRGRVGLKSKRGYSHGERRALRTELH
jgi:hypothetical protein